MGTAPLSHSQVHQVGGPTPPTPLLHLEADNPRQLQICRRGRGTLLMPGTARSGSEPEPLGDRPSSLALEVERGGGHTGPGVGALGPTPFHGPAQGWPRTAPASCPEGGFSAFANCLQPLCLFPRLRSKTSAQESIPETSSLSFRGPHPGGSKQGCSGPPPPFLTIPGRRWQ